MSAAVRLADGSGRAAVGVADGCRVVAAGGSGCGNRRYGEPWWDAG
ncbi:hypothetical protein N8I84_21390 [Streptomyces cynarae]|uniref:Uncharacterized protein n=1 Tax=Streptomyces cynarae TaxID=2981134 RepID=A0ABY6EEN4_9ACTN|nr:hypothetical protein [Streptomyces cynarae]UXY24843.1 hypothetical protein N8I84_21390 [Streptomyces cynarae]